MERFDRSRALELVRAAVGDSDARFRPGQEEAIRRVIELGGRTLLVQKTGWGKSLVYFIACLLLREQGLGPTLLISPLLALMRNQLEAARRMGVRAQTINSDNQEQWSVVEQLVADDEVDILLISPERFSNDRFRRKVLAKVGNRISMLVVDEAHCISDWGHDFRPHYRLIERLVKGFPPRFRLLATTATANLRVILDLKTAIGPDLAVLKGDLQRPSLCLQTLILPSQAERLAWLADRLDELEGHGIIYTLTVRDAETVATWLQSQGHLAEAYTGLSAGREELEEALLSNRVKALVATSALGMGFDKPDVHFVFHYQTPGSVVAYYQQVGRAGRNLDRAFGVLLGGTEDLDITDWFIESAFPTRAEVAEVLAVLEEHPQGASVPDLTRLVNVSYGRIEKTLQLLSLESPAPIVKEGSHWQLTTSELQPNFWERAERLTQLRREEQAEMQRYLRLPPGEHMKFLIQALNGDDGQVRSVDAQLPSHVSPARTQAAINFLRRSNLPFQLRRKWPPGGLPRFAVAGTIPKELQACAGRSLSHWGDAGWGRLVRDGKYRAGVFSDELVQAAVHLLQSWSPDPEPTWVTCAPSLRHPGLVPDFSRKLAGALALPFLPVICKVEETPEQKSRQNSSQQALNLDGSLAIAGEVPTGPVLLIDDIVDSGWTLTLCAWLLRTHGSGEVFPLALAMAGPG